SALDFDHNGPKRRRRRIGYAGLADGEGQQPAPPHVTGGGFDFRRVQIPCAAYRQMRLGCRGSVSSRESSDQAPQHFLLISGRLQPNRGGHPARRQTPSLRTDAISRIATVDNLFGGLYDRSRGGPRSTGDRRPRILFSSARPYSFVAYTWR